MSHRTFATQEDHFTAPAPQTSSGAGALAGLSLAMLLSSLGTSSANVALPTLAPVFNASFQEVQWVVLAYLLAITTLVVSVGRLGDIAGRRFLLLAGLSLFTGASALCGMAPTLGLLIAARVVQGLGAAVMMALTMALVRETVPQVKTGSAMGLLGAMSAIGTALGPSLGGVLISGPGWRAIFLINVPLGILSFFLSRRHLPAAQDKPRLQRIDLDAMGSLWLLLSLGSYALAMTAGGGRLGPLNVALLVTAVAGVCLFLRTEARAASPLIQLGLFRLAALGARLTMGVLVSTVMMATLVVGPFYLSRALGLEMAMVGLIMTCGPLVAALAGVPSGRMVDRLGADCTTIVGLVGMAGGSVSLSVLPMESGIVGYMTPLLFITAGYALFQTANNTAVIKEVPPDQSGVITGMLNLSRNLGLITGSSLMGAVFVAASGATGLQAATAATIAMGMRTTFAVAALMVFVALIIGMASHSLSLRRQKKLE